MGFCNYAAASTLRKARAFYTKKNVYSRVMVWKEDISNGSTAYTVTLFDGWSFSEESVVKSATFDSLEKAMRAVHKTYPCDPPPAYKPTQRALNAERKKAEFQNRQKRTVEEIRAKENTVKSEPIEKELSLDDKLRMLSEIKAS